MTKRRRIVLDFQKAYRVSDMPICTIVVGITKDTESGLSGAERGKYRLILEPVKRKAKK